MLQLLQKNRNDTVDGIAKNIGLAPATIRRHLDILQRDRLVAFREVRKRTGRPEYSFFLTESGQEALPKDYDLLLRLMVQELSSLSEEDGRSKDGQQILEILFHRLSGKVIETHKKGLDGGDFDSKLATLMRLLEEEDFYPEAEITDGEVRIRLFNCPFRSVALENQAVCAFDLGMISSMLDLDAQREECIHDGSCCVYVAAMDAGARK